MGEEVNAEATGVAVSKEWSLLWLHGYPEGPGSKSWIPVVSVEAKSVSDMAEQEQAIKICTWKSWDTKQKSPGPLPAA